MAAEYCIAEEDMSSAATKTINVLGILYFVLLGLVIISLYYCVLRYRIPKIIWGKEWKLKALIVPALIKVIGCSNDLEQRLQEATRETAVLPDRVFSLLERYVRSRVVYLYLICLCVYLMPWGLIWLVISFTDIVKPYNCDLFLWIFLFVSVLIFLVPCVMLLFDLYQNFTKWYKRLSKDIKSDEQIADICMDLLNEKFEKCFPVNQFYIKNISLGQGNFGNVCEYHLSDDLIREQCKENVIRSSDLIDYVLQLLRAHCEKMVAVKEMTSNGNAEMARREVIYLQQNSSHDNIIKLLGTCVAPDGLTPTHLVMELCQGSLKNFCDADIQRVLEEEEVALITWQILSGIEALHGKGIIHRDLTLGNILLKNQHGQANIDWESIPIDDITVKIGDFGLSRMVHDEVDSNDWDTLTQVGTPGFWAPEVNNYRYYHKSVDIYPIGVIAFHLCKKRQPTIEERHALHNGQYEPANKMEDLLQQMMNYNPNARPTAVEAKNFLSGSYDMLNPHVIQGPSTTVVDIEAIATATN